LGGNGGVVLKESSPLNNLLKDWKRNFNLLMATQKSSIFY
jgi:hypothetical protein